eukprot:m.124521 g.124521  ORF g.124521 m.124521 type:complete len:87 (-) comp15596_c0_seq6:45-305(-)
MGGLVAGTFLATACIFLSWAQELLADRAAAQISKEICQGGLESFAKQRQLLRTLKGDFHVTATLTHPPLFMREQQLQRLLKQYGDK